MGQRGILSDGGGALLLLRVRQGWRSKDKNNEGLRYRGDSIIC